MSNRQKYERKATPPGYEVIATEHGFVLRFRDADAIRNVVNLLTGQLEAIQAGALGEPPYLLGTINTHALEYMDAYGDDLKAERQGEV